MSCRQNLKKEKRIRNRVNAFRFKKQVFKFRRFDNSAQSAEDAKKADEDNKFYSMVFTTLAEEAAAVAAAPAPAPEAAAAK